MRPAPSGLTTGHNAGPVNGGFQDSEKRSLFSEFQLPVLKNLEFLHVHGAVRGIQGPERQSSTSATASPRNRRQVAGLRQCRLYGQHRSDLRLRRPCSKLALRPPSRRNDEHDVELLHGRRCGPMTNTGQPIDHGFVNTALGPEHGLNWSVGALFQTRDRCAPSGKFTFYSDPCRQLAVRQDHQATPSPAVLTEQHRSRLKPRPTPWLSAAPIRTLQAFFNAGCGRRPVRRPAFRGVHGRHQLLPLRRQQRDGVVRTSPPSRSMASTLTATALFWIPADLGLGDQQRRTEINAGYSVRSGVEFTGSAPPQADGVWRRALDQRGPELERARTTRRRYLRLRRRSSAAGTFNIPARRNAGFSNDAEVWSGSIGFNYSHGKQNLNMSARWLGSPVIDASGLGLL